jgi:glutaminase
MPTLSIASPLARYLEDLHAKYAGLRDGAVATYIPELAKASPAWFGICIATVDGEVYTAGDAAQEFTIQSVSKPLTYGIALQDQGFARVRAKIGVEPTGDAFNSISLAPQTGAPLNPMINAGAITAVSLVDGATQAAKIGRILDVFSRYAARGLTLDEVVYQSESATGHRNRAIGHMLRNFEILEDDPEPVLQAYFQQCSIAVTCRDLAVMASTLANGGVNPLTGERVVDECYVENILSVMTTCGMYDYAGEWVFTVGMPAKSGVSGGILAVLPGQLGIGVFSPLLDARGNSVRGIAVCKDLARDLNLHFLQMSRPGLTPVRTTYSANIIGSKRQRPPDERAVLDAHGRAIVVFELQGDLNFSALEKVTRGVVDASLQADYLLLDLKRVGRLDAGISWLLVNLLQALAAQEKHLILAYAQRQPAFLAAVEDALGYRLVDRSTAFEDVDAALEWCENRLIGATHPGSGHDLPVCLDEHQFFSGLEPADFDYLAGRMSHRHYRPGDYVVRKGDPADAIYLLTCGQLSVAIPLADGNHRRLATLSPGMMFGELAVVQRGPRSADVRADSAAECYVLSLQEFDSLSLTRPDLKNRLLENLLRTTAQTVYRLSDEVRVLAA